MKKRFFIFLLPAGALICFAIAKTGSDFELVLALVGGMFFGAYAGFMYGVESVFKIATGRKIKSDQERAEVLDKIFS